MTSEAVETPVIILGAGGHARVLADCLLLGGRQILGFTSPQARPDLAPAIAWLGDDSLLDRLDPAGVELVNGVGSTGTTRTRRQLFAHWSGKNRRFAVVRHPSAQLAALRVRLGQGCQLLAGCVIGPDVQLGDNVLVNSRAVVEHDCQVGDHCHVASGAVVCGGCDIGDGVHIGAGATIIQGVTIGNGAIIAAGSVVIEDVEPLTLVAGVPGQPKRALNEQDLERNQRPT